MQKKRKYFIFIGKKLTKLAQIMFKNKENVDVVRKKEEDKHLMKIADNCAKMVHRDFWRNVHKMIRFNDQKMVNDEKKKYQQEKLESLVSKQLQLSTKMANFLNSNSKKSAESKDSKNFELLQESNIIGIFAFSINSFVNLLKFIEILLKFY